MAKMKDMEKITLIFCKKGGTEDGDVLDFFECVEGSNGCYDNSDLYCKSLIEPK